jgi:hypothetical protein
MSNSGVLIGIRNEAGMKNKRLKPKLLTNDILDTCQFYVIC